MAFGKVRCIYCHKRIEKFLDYCNKCGRDIRSMWNTEPKIETPPPPVVLQNSDSGSKVCPNPRCHAPYTDGDLFCIQCRNDYGKNPPIPGIAPRQENPSVKCVYCPECGAYNDTTDTFCDCGCNFRIKPRVAVPPIRRVVFYCAVCHTNQVAMADGVCDACRRPERHQEMICPECRINKVTRYGEICRTCLDRKAISRQPEAYQEFTCPECRNNKVAKYGEICRTCAEKQPLRGMGEGFHIVQ